MLGLPPSVSGLMSGLLSGLGWIASAILLLNAALWLLQPGMVFYPTRALAATPADWGLAFEDVELTAEDGTRLHGWYIPHPDATHTLLFFHGNAGNISHRGDSIAIFNRLGLSVLIIDYRGYGRSAGRPSEAGVYLDARAARDHLVEVRGVDPKRIIIFGRSLGASVAADLAARVPSGGVILESGFSSARDMARHLYPGLHRVLYLRFDFDAAERLSRVRSPVLVLHSPHDEIVPYSLGRKLFEAAREPKRLVDLRGDHNSGFLASQPDYERSLAAFIGALGPSQPPETSDETARTR
ncbi:MAG: alpha/beta hydrolase [Thiocapsa sp.]|uniref:alpha/beta hydrolase n=1 Tax=Thiocapsa sp. TaxID=2024551 RepID=UPI001BCAE9D5|nr:alpha/beta hydrolase [Thiocapsa sp.]QVL49027.1 MAG: alpha/beta hydrolase [Thiocapsa sp.]